MRSKIAQQQALFRKYAGPLTDVSHLRYQAVFTMGAAGSGKSFVANNKWLNYLPDPSGSPRKYTNTQAWEQRIQDAITHQERGLSNLNFQKVQREILNNYGIQIVPVGGSAQIPFELFEYDGPKAVKIPRSQWEAKLPEEVFEEVEGLTDVVFSTPTHELPSYWRQVNPDLYKEELSGYMESQPGYVHEMSSDMSKSYFEAAIASGDPLVVDGTGSNFSKMKKQIDAAKANGYRVTLVWIYVPLTINMIRNANRARKVLPPIIVDQFKKIRANFEALSTVVDKADFVDNRFDKMDKKTWKKNCGDINDFFLSTTGETLYDYMLSTPYSAEVKGPYKWVQFCGQNPILEQEEVMERLQEKRRNRRRRASAANVVYMYKMGSRAGNLDKIARKIVDKIGSAGIARKQSNSNDNIIVYLGSKGPKDYYVDIVFWDDPDKGGYKYYLHTRHPIGDAYAAMTSITFDTADEVTREIIATAEELMPGSSGTAMPPEIANLGEFVKYVRANNALLQKLGRAEYSDWSPGEPRSTEIVAIGMHDKYNPDFYRAYKKWYSSNVGKTTIGNLKKVLKPWYQGRTRWGNPEGIRRAHSDLRWD